MLEVILEGRILYVLMGIVAAVGILSKIAVNLSLKRLVWAAGNMNKSNHPLMRLVKAKFEHACMVSDTVENVGVFVDKYLKEAGKSVCGRMSFAGSSRGSRLVCPGGHGRCGAPCGGGRSSSCDSSVPVPSDYR